MTKDLSWCVSQCLKMVFHIHKQKFERVAMMVMRDNSSRDAPEPFNAIGVRVVGRSVDKVQMFSQFSKHVAHEQGASRCVGFKIVSNHDGHSASLLGTNCGATHLLAEYVSGASCSDPAIEPAITPVHQAKAVHFSIVSRCFDQALPSSSFSRPNTCEGRVM